MGIYFYKYIDRLSIVINIQNTTIFEPVILTVFYTSIKKNVGYY